MKLFTVTLLAFAVASTLAGSLPIVRNTDSFQCSPLATRGLQSAVSEINGILGQFDQTQIQDILEKFVQEMGYTDQACTDETECARRRVELANYVARNPLASSMMTVGASAVAANQDTSVLPKLHRRSDGGCPLPCLDVEEWARGEDGDNGECTHCCLCISCIIPFSFYNIFLAAPTQMLACIFTCGGSCPGSGAVLGICETTSASSSCCFNAEMEGPNMISLRILEGADWVVSDGTGTVDRRWG
ncbi:hypothetical protein BJ085DRAFT_27946 [Dimargaris cristalligena]|uniref:Uncharacterized protein n=1 Tax=Dimargaris cristalligena TaxID=215637 RepID=A0A4P9ZM48_9FUNG|nr:hypothetical protein BJ085DRAFT_27946 [Dimargaris cristalligena]|eukprot:RKP33591.1 hypothetical protein BJ085DRAFT_27946 [Dimargaris cristalligena]